MTTKKVCTKCGFNKLVEEFYKNRADCIECVSKAKKARYKANPFPHLARSRKFREANPAYNKHYFATYYPENREKLLEQAHEYYLQNAPQIKANMQQAYWNDPELKRAYSRKAYWDNPEPKRAYVSQYKKENRKSISDGKDTQAD